MSQQQVVDEFKGYLERSGVVDALTKVLVDLYTETEKPANAIEFIKHHLGVAADLRKENDELRKQNEDFKKQNEELKKTIARYTNKIK